MAGLKFNKKKLLLLYFILKLSQCRLSLVYTYVYNMYINCIDKRLVDVYNLYTNDELAKWFKIVVFSKIFIGLHNIICTLCYGFIQKFIISYWSALSPYMHFCIYISVCV